MAKEQAQFAGKEDVTLKIVEKSFDAASVLVLLVHEPNLSALFVTKITRGFPSNQAGTIAFIDVVDVNLYRRTRRDTEGIGKRGHIGHRDFDQEPPARSKVITTSFPYGELVFQPEHMRYRRSRNQNQIEAKPADQVRMSPAMN